MKRPSLTIHPQAIEVLRQYDWPGNVRELANVIERAVVLASDDAIAVDDLTLDAEDVNGRPQKHSCCCHSTNQSNTSNA